MNVLEDTNNNPAGVICAANASRFDQAHFSQPLTTYALGYRDPANLEDILRLVTGTPIPAPSKFEYVEFENKDNFVVDSDDRRAIRGEFKRVELSSEKAVAKLENHGLTYRLDRDEIGDRDTMAEERAVGHLIQRVQRNALYRALQLLDASAINTAKTWNGSADPDQQMDAELIAASDITGIRPSMVLMGETAASIRRTALRSQNNAGAYANASFTPSQIGEYLGTSVAVIKSRFQKTQASKSQMLGNKVLIYEKSDSTFLEDPSNIKRFIKSGGIKVYRNEVGPKFIDLTVEHYELTKMVSTLGVRSLTISS